MRMFNSLLFLISATVATACLDAPPPAEDEALQADVVEVPFDPCPDTHADLPGQSQSCILHGGGIGTRLCTDHVTFHWFPGPMTIPPTGPRCIMSGTTVRTTCGPCLDLTLPDPGL